LVGKPERKRPLAEPEAKWMDNIKMNRMDVAWEVVDWSLVTHD
jgi:hypothetical protein